MCKTPKWIFTYSNGVVCCVKNRNPIALIFRKIYCFKFYVIIHKTHFRIERSIYIYVGYQKVVEEFYLIDYKIHCIGIFASKTRFQAY